MDERENTSNQENLESYLSDDYKAMIDKMIDEESEKTLYISAESIKTKYFK